MKCWILYNGFLDSHKFIDFAQMLQKAALSIGHEVHLLKNSDVLNLVQTKVDCFADAEQPDYVLFTDKDIYLAKQLENWGIPVFNTANTIEISDDKIKTYQHLSNAGLPIPKTIILPKTFGMTPEMIEKPIEKAIDYLQFPVIIKEAFGSFGEQVFLAETMTALKNIVYERSHLPMMLQEFIHTSYGKDVRIQVVGDQAAAAMMRTSETDFRANVTSGGKMVAYEPNDKEKEIAIKASQAIGATFSGVDLLFGPDNNPIVCEVNSNAHIRNLLDCTGIDTSFDIVKHVIAQVSERKQR